MLRLMKEVFIKILHKVTIVSGTAASLEAKP